MTAPAPSDTLRRMRDWPARNSLATFFILVFLAALGTALAPRVSVDRLASRATAGLRVRADLPGLDATTVERAVAEPLERALAKLPDLEGIESRSRYGSADILVRLIAGSDRDRALADARVLVAGAVKYLPPGMRTPAVSAVHTHDPPAAVYVVAAATATDDLVRWVRDVLVEPLREVPEIASVTTDGIDESEILVKPEPRRLAALGLSFEDLIEAVRRRELAPRRKAARRSAAVSGNVESIASRAVRLPNGEPIALAEVADVSIATVPTSSHPRSGDAPAIRLEIYPHLPTEAVHVAERTHAHLSWLRANDLVPAGATIRVLHDESQAVWKWLGRVLQRGSVFLAAILAVVAAVFGTRVAAKVAIAFVAWLPVSVAALAVSGYAISVATVAGLMLAAVPFTVLLVSGLDTYDLRRAAVVGLLSWVAALAFAVNAQSSVAYAVGLLLAVIVRWLMTPWLPPPHANASTVGDIEPVRWYRLRPPIAAAFSTTLVLGTAVLSVYWLPTVGASPNGGSLMFSLRGGDAQRLRAIVQPLTVSLRVIPNVSDIVSTAELENIWRVQLDPQRLEVAGIGLAAVGRAFAIAREGLVVGEIVDAGKRLRLRMQLAPGAAGESFERLPLRGQTAGGPAVYLRDVGTAEQTREPRERIRINGEPAVELTAVWHDTRARGSLNNFCDRIDVPEGYDLECVVRDSPI